MIARYWKQLENLGFVHLIMQMYRNEEDFRKVLPRRRIDQKNSLPLIYYKIHFFISY